MFCFSKLHSVLSLLSLFAFFNFAFICVIDNTCNGIDLYVLINGRLELIVVSIQYHYVIDRVASPSIRSIPCCFSAGRPKVGC